jgi:hypothetical protein
LPRFGVMRLLLRMAIRLLTDVRLVERTSLSSLSSVKVGIAMPRYFIGFATRL